MEASSYQSWFNKTTAMSPLVTPYSQIPPQLLALITNDLLIYPVSPATYAGPYNTQYSGLASVPGHNAEVLQQACV